MARLGALSLGPEDPCYDANHPWYLLNFLNDSVECACMAANPAAYTLGEQCATGPVSVAQTMGGQVGSVIGGGVTALGTGIGTGLGTGLSSLNFSGLMLIGVAALAVYMWKK